MTIQELINLGTGKIFANDFYKSELKRHYKRIFNDTLTVTCKNCVDDALFRFKYFLRTQKTEVMKKIENCLFALHDNQVIYLQSKHMHITNLNLTNELALDLLRSSKKNIKNFKTYPANWEQLLNPALADFKAPLANGFNDSVEHIKENVEVVEHNIKEEKLTVDMIVMRYKKDEIVAQLKEFTSDFRESDAKFYLANRLLQEINKHNESSNIETEKTDNNNGE